MRILILNWKDIKHPQVGGAEIIVYELAKRLVAQGHEVTWFCRAFKGGKFKEDIEGIHIVRRGNLLSMYLWAPLYYWQLRLKPEVVVDISNTVYWQTPLWAWQSKKLAYLNQVAADVFFYEYPQFVSRLGIFLEKLQYLTYHFTKFVCYSPSTKTDLISMGINAQQIGLFPLGLDHTRYVQGTKSSTPLFICVNRLVKMKRTDFVIQAMQNVYKKHPDTQLVIVGTGYDRPRLEKIRDELKMQSSVKFADEHVWYFQKSAKDLKVKLMQQAWALVFPSVKEGWGMTVSECGACGTMAIVTDVSGLRDSVKKNSSGLVLSINPSVQDLSIAMNNVIEDDKLRMRLSEGALKFAATLSWDKSAKTFEKLLLDL